MWLQFTTLLTCFLCTLVFCAQLWDVRSCKAPVHVRENLFNRFPMTDVIFSPDDRMLLTGTSLNRGETHAKVYMLSRATMEVVKEIDVPSHVVKVRGMSISAGIIVNDFLYVIKMIK